MNKDYFKKIVLLFLLFPLLVVAQTPQQIEEIKKETNVVKLQKLAKVLEVKARKAKQKAWDLADVNGWEKTYTDSNGAFNELIKVTENGQPIYYKTNNTKASKFRSYLFRSNVTAARATRANWLHNGGGLGLDVEGQGMTAHVWDGGIARVTHQEYDGVGGDNRVSLGDSGSLNFHAAHVMGTIVSSGVVASAKGMAPQGKGIAFDWTSDESEATTASANGMLISNHSYGYGADQIPDQWFGAYRGEARQWDEIMYNAPYYLQVTSAGNDGNNNTANALPLNNASAYDKLSSFQTAKNNLVIGNARDPEIDSEGNLVSVTLNSGSSEGPTDDLRIKPDIAGNGTGLFSTYESADDAYNTISGTSMSSPNVAGSLLLLQQHHQNVSGKFMKAATLKGLALHTADDGGQEGPDAQFGWGLMNTKKAAETITDDGLNSLILESTINQGETLTFTVKSDETNPLYASISWTDAPGETNSQLNSSTPALVNDLDIIVSNETETFLPWRLTAVNRSDKGDNVVDPYERIDLDAASGEYTITVTHKGTLLDGSQDFSLIVTGVSYDMRITSSELSKNVCSDDEVVYDFVYEQNANGITTNLSFENLPQGITAELSSNTLTESGNFQATFSDLESLTPGVYTADVVAETPEERKVRTVNFTVYSSDFTNYATTLSQPMNEAKGLSSSPTLQWSENTNAQTYFVELSDSPSFTNIISSGTVTDLSFQTSDLTLNSVYYWRVRPDNLCASGNFSEVYSFQVGVEGCNYTYDGTDFENASIPNTSNPDTNTAYIPIEITDDLSIISIKPSVQISYASIQNLTVFVQAPQALGSQNTTLLDENSCSGEDINVTFDDTGSDLACDTQAPVVSGTIKPSVNLTERVQGKQSPGFWFVAVSSSRQNPTGEITAASITVCAVEENTNIPSLMNNNVEIAANGSYTFEVSDIEATTTGESADTQTYKLVLLPTKGSITKNNVNLALGDTFTQEDVNNGSVRFVNTQTELFTDSFKVDITNGANGWLPNQTINLTATTLSAELLEIDGLNIYPNPSFGDVTIRLNPETQEKVEITLFDLQGRTILNQSFDNNSLNFNEKLNIRNLSSGVYLLNIREGNYSSTRRIIVSK